MFIVRLKLKMACNGASLAAPGPIHNLNDLLLFNGIDWRALCAASYLINLWCDPPALGGRCWINDKIIGSNNYST